MTRYRWVTCLVLLTLPLVVPSPASAQQAWIVDILANPARHWNMTVTLVGQVQTVTADPVGTTRGTYQLLDDSCPNPIVVRTTDLPPVGKMFSVTGVIIQDPAAAGTPILKEVSRTTPGMSSTMMYLLIGAGVLFLGLLVVFIALLVKPKKAAAPLPATVRARPAETVRPMPPPPAPAPPPPPVAAMDAAKTAKIPPSASYAAPSADATQRFTSLGADLVIEKGPDKGREYSLHLPVTTIGRHGARKNDLELSDETVSKDQASIYYDLAQKTFSIANESATNPTKVNGVPITGPTRLDHDCLIELGRTVVRFKKS